MISAKPYLTLPAGLKDLINKIGCHWHVVLRVGGCLELLFLFASEPQFSADSFDSMNANFYARGGKVTLEASHHRFREFAYAPH